MAHTVNYPWRDPQGPRAAPQELLSVQKLSTAAGRRQCGRVGGAPLKEEWALMPQSRSLIICSSYVGVLRQLGARGHLDALGG